MKALFIAMLVALSGCGSHHAAAKPGVLELPGAKYYPESLGATADGTLIVGSFGTGAVDRVAVGGRAATELVASDGVLQTVGVLVDESTSSLLICSVDARVAGAPVSSVRQLNLTTGALQRAYPFPEAGFCNDLAFDGEHNLYVADSFGTGAG